MSLLTEIEAAVRPAGNAPCPVEFLRTTLPPDDAADLVAAVANRAIPATAIGRALRERGHKCPDAALTSHRRGQCSCRTS